jgi:serine/threonine-protein kinase/endoribonuclease IRE1
VVVSDEHGTLKCLEGTTDRQCLTGVRALRADSRSRLARLLDGVPGPATPPLTSTTSDRAYSENTNSQVYAESAPLIVPSDAKSPVLPWEWVASLPESLSQGRNSWAHSNSGLLLALVSVITSLLWFNRKVPPDGHDATYCRYERGISAWQAGP